MKKLVVITGASSGIGMATAIKFSKAGHPLLLLARRIDRLNELKLPNTLCCQVDVTKLDSFYKAVEQAESKFGDVDLLVNNAGIMLLGNVQNQDPTEWQDMVNVNIIGVLNGIKVILAGMVKRNTGTIINISSVSGRKILSNRAVYGATKFAVHALTEAIRAEVAKSNVRVSVIAPGVVDTELLSHTTDVEIIANYKSLFKDTIDGGLKADDIVSAIEYAYNQPQNVCIREIVIAHTKQEA